MFGNVDFTLFGVSWILAGSILVALIRRYWAAVPEEGVKLGAALFMVVGMFIDRTYVGEQWLLPTTPEGWIGLVLQAFIYFGSIMGLAPGNTAGKTFQATKGAVVGICHGIKYRVLGR